MNSITTWRVHVAVPDTGHESDRMVDAATREDAIRQMADLGYRVSKVEAVATREVPSATDSGRSARRTPATARRLGRMPPDWRVIVLLLLSIGCFGLGVLTSAVRSLLREDRSRCARGPRGDHSQVVVSRST